MVSAKSRTQDGKVRSLPWATKIKHFQTSLGACLVFSDMGAVTNVFAPVRDPRRESKVPAMARENSELSDRPQNRPCLFQKLVWAPMFSARSWTQHKKVSSLPWATKIQHFQTSFRARLVFSRSGRGHNCFRKGLGHNTRK